MRMADIIIIIVYMMTIVATIIIIIIRILSLILVSLWEINKSY